MTSIWTFLLIREISLRFTLIAIFFSFLMCSSAMADQRTEKIRALMEAQGLVATFDQQLSSGREYGRRQADDMLAQMMKGLNPTEEFRAKFQDAVKDFISALEPPWGAKEVVDVWAQYYGSAFSDEEIDRLLDFYRSPLAQKEVVVARQSLTRFTEHFQSLYKPIMERVTAGYIQKLQQIARECQCRK